MEGLYNFLNELSKKQTELGHKVSNVEDGVKMSEEMSLTGQNDTKKIDNKVRKLKTLLENCMEGLEEKINLPVQELTGLLESEVRRLKVDNDNQLSELKRRFEEFENCDVVNINRRLGTARNKINEIIEKTSELGLQIKEIHRDKSSNLLLHGLPCPVRRWRWRREMRLMLISPQEGESPDQLVKTISSMMRTKLGIGREMCLVAALRLSCTRVEVNSCPPILVTFEHVHDRDTVLAKTSSLDKTSGIVVSIYKYIRGVLKGGKQKLKI